MSYNKVTLLGNLTRDVEIRFTPSGKAIGAFAVADNRKWKTEAGEQKEKVSFFDLKAFGKTAEIIAQYHKKGDLIFIDGRLEQETWDDKATGQKRSKIVIVVDSFQFVGGRRDGAAPARTQAPTGNTAPATSGTPVEEDDVPF